MKSAVLALIALAAGASSVGAQRPVPRQPLGPPPNIFGGSVTIINPVGEFDQFVGLGGGLSLHGMHAFDRDAKIGIRVDGSFVIYGHESFTEPFSDRVGRVGFDINTTNLIASLGFGPQFMLARGPVSPYVYGTVGFSYFATESSIGGDNGGEPFASTTNFDDFTGSLSAGFGMLMRVHNGRKPVNLDMAVVFVDNGRTSYLRQGGVEDLPGGRVRVSPIVSETNMVQFRFGVSVAFR